MIHVAYLVVTLPLTSTTRGVIGEAPVNRIPAA
jgi:hypothetical protein